MSDNNSDYLRTASRKPLTALHFVPDSENAVLDVRS